MLASSLLLATISLAVQDVYVLPHSHCDTGWLLTVDGYYEQSVRSILDTVVATLHAEHSARVTELAAQYRHLEVRRRAVCLVPSFLSRSICTHVLSFERRTLL